MRCDGSDGAEFVEVFRKLVADGMSQDEALYADTTGVPWQLARR